MQRKVLIIDLGLICSTELEAVLQKVSGTEQTRDVLERMRAECKTRLPST
jgi:hypothetical protein